MSYTANPNIPVIAASQCVLPSNEDFTLFFDTENSLHLTGCKNVAGVKTFYDYEIAPPSGGLIYQGTIDASTNPNFPAAVVGDIWVVSVAGSICGIPVSVGDMLLSKAIQVSGCVSNNWDIVQAENSQLTIGTHAEISALVTGNLLIAGNVYRISNPFGSPNGFGASVYKFTYTILLTANSANTFAQTSTMECTFVNAANRFEAYSIIYNFQAGINLLSNIISVSDIRNNKIGSSAFSTFQFGNDNVNSNIILSGSFALQNGVLENSGTVSSNSLINSNVSAFDNSGVISGNSIYNTSISITNNTVSIINNNFLSPNAVTITNPLANINSNNVSSGSVLLIDTNNFTVEKNIVDTTAILSITNSQSTISRNKISGGANISITNNAGEVSRNEINSGSNVSIINTLSEVTRNIIKSGSNVSIDNNTSAITRNEISNAAIFQTVNTGGLIQSNSINNASIFSVTTTTQQISNNSFNNGSIVQLQNINGQFIDNNTNYGLILVDGSTNLIEKNIVNSGAIMSLTNIGGNISNNCLSSSGILAIDTNTDVIQLNNISTSGIFQITNSASFIHENIIDTNSIVSISNFNTLMYYNIFQINTSAAITNTIAGSEFSNNSAKNSSMSLTNLGAASITSKNSFNGVNFSNSDHKGNVSNNIFENISSLVIDLDLTFSFLQNSISNITGTFGVPSSTNISNKIYNGVISSLETTVTVAPASGLIALAGNSYDEYCGIINIDFVAGAETVTQFSGFLANTINYQLQPLNGKVLTITPTAIGVIAANQIALETLVNIVLTGRTNGSDYLSVIGNGTFTRQTEASVLS